MPPWPKRRATAASPFPCESNSAADATSRSNPISINDESTEGPHEEEEEEDEDEEDDDEEEDDDDEDEEPVLPVV